MKVENEKPSDIEIEGRSQSTLPQLKLKKSDSTIKITITQPNQSRSDSTVVKHKMQQKIYPEFKATPIEQNEKNMWILKPEGLNRGFGIQVISSLEQIQQHIQECRQQARPLKPKTTKLPLKKDSKKSLSPQEHPQITLDQITKTHTFQQFLIQKYIENPLLFEGRKFDIRCYGLITSRGDLYVYNQGYLRLTAALFDISSTDMRTHLTNNAVQKLLENYSQFEEGNMKTFKELDAVIEAKYQKTDHFSQEIWPKIKQSIADCMCSVGQRVLGQFPCTNCFELFGFDFMVREDLSYILIECNANPCLELSSPVSWALIPELLDDVFDLTIDKQFKDQVVYEQLLGQKGKTAYVGKTVEDWRKIKPEDRQIEGMRWQELQRGFKVERPNGFQLYGEKWAKK